MDFVAAGILLALIAVAEICFRIAEKKARKVPDKSVYSEGLKNYH